MASQAGSYGALLAGGVLVVAGFSGHSVRDVLAGKSAPLRGLISEPPPPQTGGTPVSYSPSYQTGQILGSHGYVFPFGHGWTWGRTDQGVDFAPTVNGAPIVSPGNARVVKIGAPGWPSGGKGVLLKLLDGPLAGQFVFIYEAINPTVRVGQVVRAGQLIGRGVLGETGIEIGFSDANGVPLSHSEYTEGKVTVWGKKMYAWLKSLGTPKRKRKRKSGGLPGRRVST